MEKEQSQIDENSKSDEIKEKDISPKTSSHISDDIDKKEIEIKELNSKHNNLKDEITSNQKNYEKLLDEAADEISSFIAKANLENLSK